jgi:hypothetical protein
MPKSPSGSKTKFKVGDRVAVYTTVDDMVRFTGTVSEVDPQSDTLVVVHDRRGEFYAHEKQCRRLKPKKEPLRIGGTVSWRDLAGCAVPMNAGGDSLCSIDFAQFVGKRTRVTVEVLDEQD